jgi:hypothetical protein
MLCCFREPQDLMHILTANCANGLIFCSGAHCAGICDVGLRRDEMRWSDVGVGIWARTSIVPLGSLEGPEGPSGCHFERGTVPRVPGADPPLATLKTLLNDICTSVKAAHVLNLIAFVSYRYMYP